MKIALSIITLSLFALGCATAPTAQTDTPDEVYTDAPGVTLTVYGMSCPLCANNLDGQLMRIDGITSAEIDLDTGAITVLFANDAEVTRSQIERAVTDAGFTLRDVQVIEEIEAEEK